MKCDIIALKRKMLVKYPFFGSVVTNVNYSEDRIISTAATDGKTIYYNSDYLETLNIGEQTFIFAHEVCHIAFNHILRSEGKDPELWNIAADAVTNQFLKRDGLPLTEGAVDIADAINYDAEQLYEKLLQEKQNQQQNQCESGQGNQEEQNQQQNQENSSQGNQEEQNQQQNQENSSQGNQQEQNQQQHSQDVGHDTHSLWQDAVKKHKEEQQKQSEKDEKSLDKALNKKEEKRNLEKRQQELEKMGEKEAFKENRDERKKQLEELKNQIAELASTAGSSTNGDIRKIEDIVPSKPVIDWRYILREAIKYDVDWSYKNATFEDGVLTPSLEKQPISETEIVLDTSGSIDEVLLKSFLIECRAILRYSKIKVGCFDTKFYGFKEIRTEEDIENMQFQGGGETDFCAAVNAFSRRVENKIIFTDGKADMPKMSIDAIWIVFGGEKINPKGGKVINISEEQLDKLLTNDYQNGDSYGKTR